MKKYGLVGQSLKHSYSKIVHNIISENIKIQESYDLIEIPKEREKYIVDEITKNLYVGVNVTIPYKQTVMNQIDEISKEAKDIGAVNTIVIKGHKTYGYNTDYYGFIEMLKINNVDIKNKSCFVLGTGGAAKSVVCALSDLGAKEITLVSRNVFKAKEQFKGYNIIDYKQLEAMNNKAELIVNTTPIGMYPDIYDMPCSSSLLNKFKVAVDLIYNPLETEFIKTAKLNNLKACNGLYMLVFQAIKSQEIWNNIKISDDKINKIYNETVDEVE